MPEETQQTTAVETTASTTGAETTQAAQTQQAAPDFEALLKSMPADVQEAYSKHVAGLTSALDKERKANKKRDDELTRKEQEARDAQLSEVERLKKQFDVTKAERDELAQRVKMAAARDVLLVAAEKAKITFASQLAQQDALRLALESAEIDDDGAIKDADKVMQAVIKDREYLVKPVTQAVETNATNRGKSNGQTLDAAREAELRKRYRIR